MKTLNEYINEAVVNEGNWSFTDYERQAFATALGNMLGVLGDADDMDKYVDFRKMLSKEDLKQLNSAYDTLDDEYNYSKINNRVMKPDMPLLKQFAKFIEDNDIAGNEWDLIDAYEKILYK